MISGEKKRRMETWKGGREGGRETERQKRSNSQVHSGCFHGHRSLPAAWDFLIPNVFFFYCEFFSSWLKFSLEIIVYVCVCVCVRAHACTCAHVCMCVGVFLLNKIRMYKTHRTFILTRWKGWNKVNTEYYFNLTERLLTSVSYAVQKI